MSWEKIFLGQKAGNDPINEKLADCSIELNALKIHDILSLGIQNEKYLLVIRELLRIVEQYFPKWNWSNYLVTIVNDIPVIELTEEVFDLFDDIWAQLVYSLVNSQIITSLLEVPFTELNDTNIKALWLNNKCTLIKKIGDHFYPKIDQLVIPVIKPATMIAIWWPSWVGKTTVITRLNAILWDKILTWSPWYTTRPIRQNERDGRDYHFRSIEDFYNAKNDVRFNGFIEARWNWYWNKPSIKFKQILRSPGKLSITSLNQTQEVMENKKIFPHLRWIWMLADEQEIKKRLSERRDNDLEKSLHYNWILWDQNRDWLVDFYIENGKGSDINTAVQKVLDIINILESS